MRKPMFGIRVPSVNGQHWSWAVGNDWEVKLWTKKASAQAWLRRYAPNWYLNGAWVDEHPREREKARHGA
jgi:hypothetical protein